MNVAQIQDFAPSLRSGSPRIATARTCARSRGGPSGKRIIRSDCL